MILAQSSVPSESQANGYPRWVFQVKIGQGKLVQPLEAENRWCYLSWTEHKGILRHPLKHIRCLLHTQESVVNSDNGALAAKPNWTAGGFQHPF